MSVISNAKEIADLVKKLGDIELYKKIVELEGEIIEITRANHTLELRVEELTKSLEKTEHMNFKEPFYYVDGDSVPYCPNCWEGDKLTVHLFNCGYYRSTGDTKFICHQCKSNLWYRGQYVQE